jgi:hypothetical protein
MDAAKKKQKIYVYIDEAGQDDASKTFTVVAIGVFGNERDTLERTVIELEDMTRTGRRKWNHATHSRRIAFLTAVLERKVGKGNVFFGVYQKPIHYFFPVVEIIEKAITHMVAKDYIARVYVDGANKTAARALTNDLRPRRISTRLVKGKREESEALIRLADMWAGCIRNSFLGKEDAKQLFERATKEHYLLDIGI